MPTSPLVLTVRHTPRERPSSRGFFKKIVEGPDYSLPLTSTSCGRLLASCRPSSYSATYSYGSRNVCLTHVSPPKTNRFTLICGFSITPHRSNHTYENLQFQRRHQFQPQFHTGTPMKTCVPRLRNNDPCVHISLCTGQCVI